MGVPLLELELELELLLPVLFIWNWCTVCLCWRKLSSRENFLKQKSHWKGLSPVCFLMCLAKCSDLVKIIEQPGYPVHWKSFPLDFFGTGVGAGVVLAVLLLEALVVVVVAAAAAAWPASASASAGCFAVDAAGAAKPVCWSRGMPVCVWRSRGSGRVESWRTGYLAKEGGGDAERSCQCVCVWAVV